jgi:hypothetical protein
MQTSISAPHTKILVPPLLSLVLSSLFSLLSSSPVPSSLSFFLLLKSMIPMLLDWVSFLAYPNLFGIKGFVVVVML